MVEKHTGREVKVLRSDNGGEYVYVSSEMRAFMKSRGIVSDLTVPNNPHQNGVSERLNCTLIDLVRSMLRHRNVDKDLWAEVLAAAVHIRNRVTTRSLDSKTTPFEVIMGESLVSLTCVCLVVGVRTK